MPGNSSHTPITSPSSHCRSIVAFSTLHHAFAVRVMLVPSVIRRVRGTEAKALPHILARRELARRVRRILWCAVLAQACAVPRVDLAAFQSERFRAGHREVCRVVPTPSRTPIGNGRPSLLFTPGKLSPGLPVRPSWRIPGSVRAPWRPTEESGAPRRLSVNRGRTRPEPSLARTKLDGPRSNRLIFFPCQPGPKRALQ